jgi:chromosome partitioning protein
MDPQGNATSGVGIDKKLIEYSIYDSLIGEKDIDDIIKPTEYSGLYLIPANVDLIGAEIELTKEEEREFKLKNVVSKIKDDFDFFIIDCPPSLGLLTLNALCASDSVIIPLQAEYFALEGLSQLIHTLELVEDGLNKSLEIEGILITMCDIRTNLAKQVIDEAKNYFGGNVYKTIIPRNIKLAESPSFGKPIVYYDIRSIGAEKYLEFSGEVLKANNGKNF